MAKINGKRFRILVTGGSGFIGTNLIADWISRGARVLNCDRNAPRNPAQGAYWKKIDILDFEPLYKEIRALSPTHIFHLAARTDLEENTDLKKYDVNTTGVRNLIRTLESLPNLERVVFASSLLVCKNGYRPSHETDYRPDTLYGKSKAIGEEIVRESSIPCPWMIVRPTSIWGPWFGEPYKSFFLRIAGNRYFHPGNSATSKTFGYVGNVIHQLARLMLASADEVNQKTFYLADYHPYDIRNWANLIQRTMSTKKIKTIPLAAIKLAASVGDLIETLHIANPPITRFRLRNMLTNNFLYDLSSIQSIVPELPYSLERGVEMTIQWLQQSDLTKRN